MFSRHKCNFDNWSKLVNTENGVMQYRKCSECNLVEKRNVGSINDFNLNSWNTDKDKPKTKEVDNADNIE